MLARQTRIPASQRRRGEFRIINSQRYINSVRRRHFKKLLSLELKFLMTCHVKWSRFIIVHRNGVESVLQQKKNMAMFLFSIVRNIYAVCVNVEDSIRVRFCD